jgi:phosphatidylglycerol:prolipoprotein diacylglycerol transferase
MFPVLLSIGSFKLYTYGLFVAIGFLSAMTVSKVLGRREGIQPEKINDLYFVILLCAIVGARGLYVFISFDTYKDNLIDIFKIWNGGLVFFGGFIAAVLGTLAYIKYKQLPLWKTADIIVPGIALGHALGRIGCFFAGCCHGRECDLPFAIVFTHPESLAPLNIPLYPTQLVMAASNLLVFGIMLVVYHRKKFHGMVFLTYIMIYSFFRSMIEFFRGDFRGDFFFDFISLSQGIGLTASVIALLLLIVRSRKAAHGSD